MNTPVVALNASILVQTLAKIVLLCSQGSLTNESRKGGQLEGTGFGCTER